MEWGNPIYWGWFLLFSRSGGHKTKETYPTRPGSPTPGKQGLRQSIALYFLPILRIFSFYFRDRPRVKYSSPPPSLAHFCPDPFSLHCTNRTIALVKLPRFSEWFMEAEDTALQVAKLSSRRLWGEAKICPHQTTVYKSSRICWTSFRRITFKIGIFTYFMPFFPAVSTDFP